MYFIKIHYTHRVKPVSPSAAARNVKNFCIQAVYFWKIKDSILASDCRSIFKST